MKGTWHYYRAGQPRPKAAGVIFTPQHTKLDIMGEKPWDHYSFVFKTTPGGKFIQITATCEYFDKTRSALVPANKKNGASLEDITDSNEYDLRFVLSAIEGAGITADNFTEFWQAGMRILDK